MLYCLQPFVIQVSIVAETLFFCFMFYCFLITFYLYLVCLAPYINFAHWHWLPEKSVTNRLDSPLYPRNSTRKIIMFPRLRPVPSGSITAFPEPFFYSPRTNLYSPGTSLYSPGSMSYYSGTILNFPRNCCLIPETNICYSIQSLIIFWKVS
jgi:hypothetical protein